MSFSPEDSRISVNPSLEERIFNAKTHYEVAEILRQAAVDQRLVVPDRYSPDILLPVDPGTPKAHAKTVTIAGKTHVFEAATEAEADAQLLAFFRQNFGNQPTEQPAERPRDSDTGRFVARNDEPDPVAASEIELRFRRGEISTEDYLAQSGAIERHLEANGVSIEALQAATAERTTASWQSATEEFLKTSDWPGGEINLQRMSEVLKNMGATDYPNVENLKSAYEYMKANGLIAENPELAARERIASATTPEELRAAAQAAQGRSSSMFNR
jgi:hypothetical protein